MPCRSVTSGRRAVRYAHHVLDLPAGHRRVVMRNVDALEAGASAGEVDQLRRALATIAAAWEKKANGWRSEWPGEPDQPPVT